MNTSSQSIGLNSETNLKECWWMQAGVVDYKLCDRDYDCEHCPFDEIFHGAGASRSPTGKPLPVVIGTLNDSFIQMLRVWPKNKNDQP